MLLKIDHTEVITLLENNSNICDACLLVQTKAAVGDLMGMVKETERCMQLIIQAVKSNTSILHQVKTRNLLNDT